jgi:RHS repeat-associated protein
MKLIFRILSILAIVSSVFSVGSLLAAEQKKATLEEIQSALQERYYAVKDEYIIWPTNIHGASPGYYPTNGFYASDCSNANLAASHVSVLITNAALIVRSSFNGPIYICKSSIDGIAITNVIQHQVRFPVLPQTGVSNYVQNLERASQYVCALKRIALYAAQVGSSGSGDPEGKGEHTGPEVSCDAMQAEAEWIWEDEAWGESSATGSIGLQVWNWVRTEMAPTCTTNEIGAGLVSIRGRFSAVLTNFTGSGDLYLQVKPYDANGGISGQNPPYPTDRTLHWHEPAQAGRIFVSDQVLGTQKPEFSGCPTAAACEDERVNVYKNDGWQVEHQCVVINANFIRNITPCDADSCESCGCTPGTVDARNKCILVDIKLGDDANGKSVGKLSLNREVPTADMTKPQGLAVEATSKATLIYTTNGVIRQLVTPQSLVDVVSTTNQFKYDVKFYHLSDLGEMNEDGFYEPTGSPHTVVTLENPNATSTNISQFKVTRVFGSQSNIWDFSCAETNGVRSTTLITESGLRTEIRSSELDFPDRTETFTVKNGSGTVVSKEKSSYYTFAWGEELVEKIVDPDGAALTNSWDYYTSSTNGGYQQVQQAVYPAGNWEKFEYDSAGRESKRIVSYANESTSASENDCRVYTTSYAATNALVTRIEKLLGQEISRRYTFYQPGEQRDILAYTNGAAWNDANNLVTTTKYYIGTEFSGEVASIENPDGTMSFYSYSQSGDEKTTTIRSGQPNGGKTDIVDGTERVMVESFGRVTSDTTTCVPTTGLTDTMLNSAIVLWSDELKRPTSMIYNDGTVSSNGYSCCGLSFNIDREGITTSYDYDGLKRVVSTTRAGVTTSNCFDAVGHTTKVLRNNVMVEASGYDVAGRQTVSTNALNQATSLSYSTDGSGQSVIITTYPNAKSKVETYYKDGSLLSVTGAMVHPLKYEYGVDGSGVYTKEIRLGSGGSETEWVKTYTDFLGRPYKTVYPDGAAATSYFNNKGQLTKQVDPDGIITLYDYNAKGEQEYVAISADSSIDTSGADRVTRTQSEIANGFGTTVRKVTTSVFGTGGSSSETVVSISESSLSGLTNWSIAFGMTNQNVVSYNGSGGRSIVTTNPDGTTQTSVFQNGRVTGVTNKVGATVLSSSTITYDSVGRQSTVTDARGVVSTMSYNNGDLVTTNVVSGSGGLSQSTIFTYDTMGRRFTTILPDGGAVTNEYWEAGELKKVSGARTYTSEYTYDTQGRIKTLLAGQGTTTWSYSTNRGFLVSKQYNDTFGPDYTYTSAGRLQTRTWERGTSATYSYNPLGDLSGINYSDSTPDVSYGFDRRGRRTAVTNGTDILNLTYNNASQPLIESYSGGPLNGVIVTNSYNALLLRDNLSVAVNSSAVLQHSYTYDSASRLSVASDGTRSGNYSYGLNSMAGGIVFKESSTTRMTTTNSYDGLARRTLISSTPSADSVQSFSYTYNSANQRTRNDLADGSYWEYAYDGLGQVTNGVKKLSGGTAVPGEQFGYSFDNIGNRLTETRTGELGARTSTYTTNALNQYTQRTVPGVADFAGIATSNANVTLQVGTKPAGIRNTTRDGTLFYKGIALTNTTVAVYTNINIVGVATNSGPSGEDTVTIASGKVFLPKTPEAFTYDADGNLTSDGRWNYTWDAENRLIQMEALTNLTMSARKKLEFAYDGQGRRIQKIVSTWNGSSYGSATTNKCIYSGWNKVADLNGANGVVKTYMWGSDLSGSMEGAGGVGGLLLVKNASDSSYHFVAMDANGNVSALVNAADGIVSAEYEYSPFGETLRASGTMADANPFRFSTKYQDDESGLLYYGYRYYNPSTGRWLGRDPIEENGGENLYGFVLNNAVDYLDILGLKCNAKFPLSSDLLSALDAAWKASFNKDGTVMENGGSIFSGANGKQVVKPGAQGTSGEIQGNQYPTPGNNQTFGGTFHSHPYSKAEGGHTGVSFSSGDIEFLAEGSHGDKIIVTGGTAIFVLTVDDPKKAKNCLTCDKEWQKGFNSNPKNSFQSKVEAAVKNAVKTCGMCYYKATKGKNGKFPKEATLQN